MSLIHIFHEGENSLLTFKMATVKSARKIDYVFIPDGFF